MVKALNHQEPTESRRLWREVTEEWISYYLEAFDFISKNRHKVAMALMKSEKES